MNRRQLYIWYQSSLCVWCTFNRLTLRISSIHFSILSSSFCISIISSSITPSLPRPSHSANTAGGCPSLSLSLSLSQPPPSLSLPVSVRVADTRSLVARWFTLTSQLLAKEEKKKYKTKWVDTGGKTELETNDRGMEGNC